MQRESKTRATLWSRQCAGGQVYKDLCRAGHLWCDGYDCRLSMPYAHREHPLFIEAIIVQLHRRSIALTGHTSRLTSRASRGPKNLKLLHLLLDQPHTDRLYIGTNAPATKNHPFLLEDLTCLFPTTPPELFALVGEGVRGTGSRRAPERLLRRRGPKSGPGRGCQIEPLGGVVERSLGCRSGCRRV